MATVLWVMTEISISRAQGPGEQAAEHDRPSTEQSWRLHLVSHSHYCFFSPTHRYSPCPAANPKLQASIDLCYLQTAWCTTAEQQGSEVKTKQHRARNSRSAQISDWKSEKNIISLQKRTIWMLDLYGKLFCKWQASKTRCNPDCPITESHSAEHLPGSKPELGLNLAMWLAEACLCQLHTAFQLCRGSPMKERPGKKMSYSF